MLTRRLSSSRALAIVTSGLFLAASACGGQAAAPSPSTAAAPVSAKPASSAAAPSSASAAAASSKPAGSTGASAKPSGGASAAGGAKKHVVLGLAVSPPNLVHIVPFVAQDMGFFAEEGLNVEIKQFAAGGTQALRGSVAGGVDLAWADATSTMVAAARGAGDKIIMAPAPKSDLAMMAQPGINSIQDLKGKKIGLSGEVGSLVDILNRAVLQKANIDPKDVTIVQTTTAGRVAGLVEKKTDTAVVHQDQTYRIEQQAPTVKTISKLWEALPDFYYAVLEAETKVYDADPKTYDGVVRGMIKASRFMYQNKDKTLEIAAKYTKEDPAVLAKTYADLASGKVWSVNGGLSQQDVDYDANLLVQLGKLKPNEKPAYAKLVEPKFVNDALSSLGKQGTDL